MNKPETIGAQLDAGQTQHPAHVTVRSERITMADNGVGKGEFALSRGAAHTWDNRKCVQAATLTGY